MDFNKIEDFKIYILSKFESTNRGLGSLFKFVNNDLSEDFVNKFFSKDRAECYNHFAEILRDQNPFKYITSSIVF